MTRAVVKIRESSKIKEELQRLPNGGELHLAAGEYFLNLIIDKPITLSGEGKKSTLGAEPGTGPVLHIRCKGVRIEDLYIQHLDPISGIGIHADPGCAPTWKNVTVRCKRVVGVPGLLPLDGQEKGQEIPLLFPVAWPEQLYKNGRSLCFLDYYDPVQAWHSQLQTGQTLKPFLHYLRQSIRVAKDRQSRYQLPWTPIREEVYSILLEPAISIFSVRLPPGGYRLLSPKDWDPPNPQDILKIVNRWKTVNVLRTEKTDLGLFVHPAELLHPDDLIYWNGIEVRFADHILEYPNTVLDSQQRSLDASVEFVNNDFCRMVFNQADVALPLLWKGSPLDAVHVSPYEKLTELKDSGGRYLDPVSEFGPRTDVRDIPTLGPLLGNNGYRFNWRQDTRDGRGRKGYWIQLLLPEKIDPDDYLDPRARFCEDDIDKVLAGTSFFDAKPIPVERVNRDTYRLRLSELPIEGTTLYLPINTLNLDRQRKAIEQLEHSPLKHHRGLIRLTQNPGFDPWPKPEPIFVEKYFELNSRAEGTDIQQRFVEKALGTPDFAFLEGPPGSGKTTVICELILQFIAREKNVLLCSSTHTAVDNVLERLAGKYPQVEAVRIGRVDRVDAQVCEYQLDRRIETLVAKWKNLPHLLDLTPEEQIENAARRLVLSSANLTCGTTIGILSHPFLNSPETKIKGLGNRDILTRHPHFDVLIVDEASKTTVQEFIVPALLAKKWIIVGDIQQLPPFTDRAEITANLQGMVNEQGQIIFPPEYQRAKILFWNLSVSPYSEYRWLISEKNAVLNNLIREIEASKPSDFLAIRIVRGIPRPPNNNYREIPFDEIRKGDPVRLYLLSADWVMVEDSLLEELELEITLPTDLLRIREKHEYKNNIPTPYRQKAWLTKAIPPKKWGRIGKRENISVENLRDDIAKWFAGHDWAGEMAWRLTRLHELNRSSGEQGEKARARLREDIESLMPLSADIKTSVKDSVGEIQTIGLPSVLECLQRGVGQGTARYSSSLSAGISPEDWNPRFESLKYQHRMHPDISDLPRILFYEGDRLKDVSSLPSRDDKAGWMFSSYARFIKRRVWLHVPGRLLPGIPVNKLEIVAMRDILIRFLKWAESNPIKTEGGRWEVACLTFYLKQQEAISAMLKDVTGQMGRSTRFNSKGVDISCGTVDRFQGREADLVLLSMRNTERVGFLDSPNRLNVAITRARRQLVIIGNHEFFYQKQRKAYELKMLADPQYTPVVQWASWTKGMQTT